MVIIKSYSVDIVPSFINYKNRETKTTHKMRELMEINNAIRRHKSEPQLFMIALLSSFVICARSITFIMQKEYAHTVGFEEWYTEKQKIMREDKTMKFFAELRVETVHNDILFITRSFHYILKKEIDISCNNYSFPVFRYEQNGDYIIVDKFLKIDGKLRKDIPIETKLKYYFRDNKEKQAPEMCTDHFMKLAKITSECNGKFNPIYSTD